MFAICHFVNKYSRWLVVRAACSTLLLALFAVAMLMPQARSEEPKPAPSIETELQNILAETVLLEQRLNDEIKAAEAAAAKAIAPKRLGAVAISVKALGLDKKAQEESRAQTLKASILKQVLAELIATKPHLQNADKILESARKPVQRPDAQANRSE